jgi:predicted Zn-dependent protease
MKSQPLSRSRDDRPLCAATRFWRRGALLLLPLLAVAGVGCAPATDKAVRLQADQFQTSLSPAEVSDPVVNDYFQRIGQRIVAAGQELDKEGVGPKSHFDKKESENWMFQNIQFHLVNSKTLNAFTTGGNHVYIYNELLQLCDNEDELAAVMSHEYGHIYCRHVQKGSGRQLGAILPALLLGGAGYLAGGKEHGAEYAQAGAGLGAVAGQLGVAHFSRADEAQADQYGFKFYTRAGWDPQHFGDFFQALIQKGGDATPEILSDHPSLAGRVAAAKKEASQLGPRAAQFRQPPIMTPAQFADIKQRAQAAAARTPSDQSLQNSKTLLQALPRSCLMEDNPNPPSAQQAQQQIQEMANRAAERSRTQQGDQAERSSYQSERRRDRGY